MRDVWPPRLGAAIAIVLVAAAASGCGDGGGDLPPDAVAVVGDAVITKKQFNELGVGAPGRTMGSGGGSDIVYDPPDFSECVRAKQANRPVATGQEAPLENELKHGCEEGFQRAKETVLPSLIYTEWQRQEARRLKVFVSTAAVKRQVARYLSGASGSEKADFALGLASLGRPQLIAQVQADLVQERLLHKVRQRAPKVTDAKVRRYYEEHRNSLAAAERRTARVVLASDREQADAARRALERGMSWGAVVNRYSIDDATKARGGRIAMTRRDRGDNALTKAVFAAEPDRVVGPVESQFGWYILTVSRVTGEQARSLADSGRHIKRILRTQREEAALRDFESGLVARYGRATTCAAHYEVDMCGGD